MLRSTAYEFRVNVNGILCIVFPMSQLNVLYLDVFCFETRTCLVKTLVNFSFSYCSVNIEKQ